jgi:asparagine synthase (glutamine-hydrolysing)
MMAFPALAPATPWFVALSDSPAADDRVAAVLSEWAPQVLRGDTGRPWLLGRWSADEIVTAEAGSARLALIGCCPIGPARLTRLLERADDVAALDALVSSLPGSFHVVAQIRGRTRVQGTASGLRRVFYTRIRDRITAADRADVLAGIAEMDVDVCAVALSLLDPLAPHPLDDRPMWRGVAALPPDRYLLVGHDGRPSEIRWWRQPAPELPLAEGAPLLRTALADAVAARTAGGGTVSCDLSGGLDSTSVCFLAARGTASLVTFTGVGRDPGDDDAEWVARAVTDLPGLTREILPRQEMPLVYDGIATAGPALDRPFIGIIDRAKMLAGLDRLRPYRPRVHLTGLGGDEVAQGTANYLPGLVRAHPLIALDRLRGFRAQGRWPLRGTLRMFRPRSYHACLADIAAFLGGATVVTGFPALDWVWPPRLPAWVTPRAAALVVAAFEAALDTATPLAGTRDQHGDMMTIRSGAAVARSFAQLVAGTGIPLAAPFLDDRVVEACLAVRAADRTTPWEYKPLLKEAMRTVVPAGLLRRVTKAEGSAEEAGGLRANHAELTALCEGSRLAEAGLVDAAKLRAGCRYSPAPDRPHEPLQQTFAGEVWLRAVGDNPTTGVPGTH